MTFTLQDDSELWLAELFANDYEGACSRVSELLSEGTATDTGCIVTDTTKPRKVRFHGRQVAAYRLIYCILNRTIAGYDDVIRHQCHNRLRINPENLTIGNRADNKRDDWEFLANGVDFDLL